MVHSAQDFIRALKAPSDPPQAEGLTKIEIATTAWSDSSFYIPNKDEVITDWALTRLLKDKDKEPSNNPLLDRRYWDLLRRILTTSRPLGTLRSTKPWLIPLLSRVPIIPIIITLWKHLSQGTSPDDAELASVASQCLSLLWPLAVPKFNADTLLDGFGAVLRVFNQLSGRKLVDEDTVHLATLVVHSYTSSAANTTNRKKLYLNFKEHHLRLWLIAIVSVPGPVDSTRLLSQAVYDAGIETIFNAEVLRIEESNFVDAALTQLTGEIPDVVLQCLPRLFTSYSQNTRRHRSALYGQGSNQQHGASLQHARRAAISCFASCDNLLGRTNSSELAWGTRLALLRAVVAENLYIVNDETATNVLRTTGENAAEAIVMAIRDDDVPHGDLALFVVSVILEIDYDLIASPVAMVLPKLLLWPSAPASAQKVLRQAMDFHTKTRTMDEFVELCLQSCTNPNAREPTEDTHALYTALLRSPVLTREFLDELSRCIRFLTPGQIPHIVRDVARVVSETLEAFSASETSEQANSGVGSRKKRRSDAGPLDKTKSLHAEHHALSFTLAAGLAAIVLSSVPLQSLQHDVRNEVKQTVHELCDTLKRSAKEGLKQVKNEQRRDIWGWEITLAAILRLQYLLGAVAQLEAPPSHGDKALSRMITLLKSESALPELRAELCRSLLHAISAGLMDHRDVFDTILNLFDRSKPNATSTWNGRLHGLAEHQLPVAMFYLLLERWLPLFDSLGTEEQLKRLANFMSRISTVTKASDEQLLSITQVWWMTLRNAQFWELQRIRDALLSQIGASSQEIPPAALYGLLLWMPIEYLSRAARSELLKRGISADLSGQTFVNGAQDVMLTSMIREFVNRALSHMGAADHPAANEYLKHLIDTPANREEKTTLQNVTLGLIRMHITSLIRDAIRGDDKPLQQLAESFAKLDVVDQDPSRNLLLESFVEFVDVLTDDFSRQDLKLSTIAILTELHSQIVPAARSRMGGLVMEGSSRIMGATVFLELYHRLLVLRQWLRIEDKVPHFGRILAGKVIAAEQSTGCDRSVYTSILAINQQELSSAAEGDRVTDLECIIATTVSFYRLTNVEGQEDLEASMSKFCRIMTSSDHSVALDCIWDGLSDPSMSESDLVNLVRLSSLFMHNSPEGSLKTNQNHWSKCLELFANRPQFLDEPALATAVLESIAKKVNDRPASLRQQDLSSLWSILGSCVAGSSQHRGTTSHQIFRKLVSVISALVRLRRDLVVSTLPHLGIVLRRLILCLKHLQPQLGAKQSRIVASSLPKWINLTDPLTVEDSKAVARLLTTLTTKTIARTHSSSTSTQKAESLARPFSKHAAHVLGGYIDALNDPLSFIPADMRRELQPGLFALCEMMGEQNRDSMMVTLDTGGKAVMKMLWRDYEKQRYTGKG